MNMKRRQAPAITWITTLALLVSMCASLTFSQRTSAQSTKDKINQQQPAEGSYPLLSKYATDLTLLALKGKLDANPDRDADVARVIAKLAHDDKALVVISESDLDRDVIARGVAAKIAFGDVPDSLRAKRVFRLSLDALAKGARTSDEFAARVESVFAEAAQSAAQLILFVDQLHEYAGTHATALASASVKQAIEANHLRVIGGASTEAYTTYIASDETVAKLFESISIDRVNDSAATTAKADKRRSPIKEEFEGEKISSDMQELIKSAGPNGHVTAILQVSDVNSKEVRALLARNGVQISDSMANVGAMKVDLPVKAIDALMKSGSMNYISPEVRIQNLDATYGHVVKTTGTDQVRNAPGLLSGLLGASAIDGTGIGIAVLDSGVDTSHAAFAGKGLLGTGYRLVFTKDFTAAHNTSTPPDGHG